MGRGILSLKLISNPKSRRTTFQKRKKSLIKKAYELSTLCDVRTCLFIASSSSSSSSANDTAEFETWPPNRNEIEGMIRAYKSHSFHRQSTYKSFDLRHFFSDRTTKIQTETSKLRDNVDKIQHPNWDQRLDCLSEHELKGLMGVLDSKIGVVDGMIEFMEADYDHLLSETSTLDSQCPVFSPLETNEYPQFLEGSSVPNLPMMPIEELDISDFLVEDFRSLLDDQDLQSLLLQNNDFHIQY